MKKIILLLSLVLTFTALGATVTEVRFVNGEDVKVFDSGAFIVSQYNSSSAQSLYDQWSAGSISVEELNTDLEVLRDNQLDKSREVGINQDPDCTFFCENNKYYTKLIKFDGIPARVLYTHITSIMKVEHNYFNYKATISLINRFAGDDEKNVIIEIDILLGVGFAMTPQSEIQDFIDDIITPTSSLMSAKSMIIEKDALNN